MGIEERVGVSIWGSTVGSGSALYWTVSGNLFHGRKLWSSQRSGEQVEPKGVRQGTRQA